MLLQASTIPLTYLFMLVTCSEIILFHLDRGMSSFVQIMFSCILCITQCMYNDYVSVKGIVDNYLFRIM